VENGKIEPNGTRQRDEVDSPKDYKSECIDEKIDISAASCPRPWI
jgi:hypothetical protein